MNQLLKRCLVMAMVVMCGLAWGQVNTSDVVTLNGISGVSQTVEVSQSNFDVEVSSAQRGLIPEIVSRADAARRSLNNATGDALLIRIRIVLAPSHAAFHQLAGPGTENSTAVSLKNRATIIMNADALRADGFEPLGRILVHELVHVYLDARCRAPVPRWMHEGLAQIITGEWTGNDASAVFATRVLRRLIPLGEIENSFPNDAERQQLAYRQSSSIVQYLIRERHSGSLRHLLTSISGEEGVRELELYWSPLYRDALQAQWRDSLTGWGEWTSLLLNSVLVWGIAALLLVLAWWIKRQRNQRLRAEWAEEDKVLVSLDDTEHDAEEWYEHEYEDEYDAEGNWRGRKRIEP